MALKKIYKCTRYLIPAFSPYSQNYFNINYHCTVFYKMNTVYFLNEKGENTFRVNLAFRDEALDVNKTVNFERKMNESLGIFLNRLKEKLHKLIEKKLSVKKKKTGVTSLIPDFNPILLLNDEPMANDTVFFDIFNNKINGSIKLQILDSYYDVVINAPTITRMTLPSKIRIGSAVYPEKFEATCIDKDKCIFKWFKSLPKKITWVECGEGFCYIPDDEDIEHFLKLSCTPKNELNEGPVCEVISESCIEKFSGGYEIKKRHQYTKNRTNNEEIRIVSYNILADLYVNTKEAKTSLFTYCNPSILELNYRKDLWSMELSGYNADLICLQEVDKKVFKNIFYPIFNQNNYFGVFHEKEGMREGCAFFFCKKKFELLNSEEFNLTHEIMNNPSLKDFKEKIEKNSKLIERLLNLQNLIQVGVLKCLTNSKNLIVFGNTHLYFHPDADHIRLLQGLTGFRILLNTVELTKKEHPDKFVSLILCGDFNSTPECGFHQFLNKNAVDSNHIDWKSKEDEAIEDISCTHSLKMKSACGTPQYTNYTSLFKACLDYIYFETEQLEVKQIVPFPAEETLSQQIAIPSEFFPSDHLALIVDLKFKAS